jgi:hypothetical protein
MDAPYAYNFFSHLFIFMEGQFFGNNEPSKITDNNSTGNNELEKFTECLINGKKFLASGWYESIIVSDKLYESTITPDEDIKNIIVNNQNSGTSNI